MISISVNFYYQIFRNISFFLWIVFQIFCSVTNVWRKLSTTGVAPRPRDKVSSAVIEDKIYIFGGFGPQGCENDHEGAQNDEVMW